MAGNIWEIVQDGFVAVPPTPCIDCATLTPSMGVTMLGGSWYGNSMFLLNSERRTFNSEQASATSFGGIRCARDP